jgi:16S rRNA processing protein RimM
MTEIETGYRLIAHVSRTRGRKGEVVLRALDDFSLRLSEGQRLWVVPPANELPREFGVESVVEGAKGVVVRLTGIETLDRAGLLVNRFVLARYEDVLDATEAPQLSSSQPSPSNPPASQSSSSKPPASQFSSPEPSQSSLLASDGCIGFSVIDTAGRDLGVIRELRKGHLQNLWVVDGPAGEVLIPAVAAFVVRSDPDTALLQVDLPEGLLDLNRRI